MPFSIITKDGPLVLPTEAAINENFEQYLNACDAMRLDLVGRIVVSLDDCQDGTWLGTFQTRLLSQKTNPANTPIVGQSDVRGSFSIIDTQISVFNRFCVETICNA